MTKKIPAVTARTQFGQIMERAAVHGERFLVEKNGEPAVMILSVADFAETLAPGPGWLKEMGAESRQRGLDKLTMADIDDEIAAARRERRAQQQTA